MRKWIVCSLVAAVTLVSLLGAWALSPAPEASANPGTNWNASYWNNRSLSGSPVITRVDNVIDFNWAGGSPDPAIPADNFSARWTKTVNFPTSGRWHFKAGADDGIRVWIDATLLIDQWHDAPGGFTTYSVTLDQLTAGNHDLRVEYYEAGSFAGVQFLWWPEGGQPGVGTGPGAPATSGGAASWSAFYWNNATLSGNPTITRTDARIDFNWAGGSPDPAIPADNFSARWLAKINFPTPGPWRFKAGADDGVRVWIDQTLIIDEWHGSTAGFSNYEVDVPGLTAGDHDIRVEYFETTGNAGVQVQWWQGTTPGAAPGATAAPTQPPVKPIWAAVTADSLNVRRGPGRGYEVIAQINYPDNYLVKGALGDMTWIMIELKNGTLGWVHNDWVWLWSDEPDFVSKIPRVEADVLPGESGVVPPGPVTVRGRTTATLNLRDGASVRAKDIGGLPEGAVVLVEARNRNGAWYLVTYQGMRGWVSAPFVILTEGRVSDLVVSTEVVPAPPPGQVFVPEDEAGRPAVTVRGVTYTDVKLRDAASVRGTDLGTIPQDTELVIEGRNTNGAWYLVTYNGQQGWVSSPFVRLVEGTVQDLQIR